jgi:hypothetical protein
MAICQGKNDPTTKRGKRTNWRGPGRTCVLRSGGRLDKTMTKTAKTTKVGEGAPRSDGRKALLLYLKPEVTLALKKAALDAGKPAYELAEEAIMEWLKRQKK